MSSTAQLRLPRGLLWAVRSRYDQATAEGLFSMIWHRQRETDEARRGFLALLPLPLLVMLTLAAPAASVGHWTVTGALLLLGISIAAARFRNGYRHYRARIALWNRDPARWQAVSEELVPVERDCLDQELESVSFVVRP